MGLPEPVEPAAGEVISIEDRLVEQVQQIDAIMDFVVNVRENTVLLLHSLRSAQSDKVAAAVEDYNARVAGDRPYEDAVDVDQLLAAARTR